MTISQKIEFPILNKDTQWETQSFLCLRNFLFVGALNFLCRFSRKGSKNSIVPVRAIDMSIIIILVGLQVPILGGCACLAIIMRHMIVVIPPSA
jgi:hypothetical protein